MPTKTMYGIQNAEGKLYGVNVTSNVSLYDEYCNSYEAALCILEDNVWLMTREADARRVLEDPVQWYNSSMERPQHTPQQGDRVVEVVLHYSL